MDDVDLMCMLCGGDVDGVDFMCMLCGGDVDDVDPQCGVSTSTHWTNSSRTLFPVLFLTDQGVVGWCDGAGKTSSAGASYNLDYCRARAYCACSRCGCGLFGHFYSHLSFCLLFLPLFGRRPDID